MEGTSLTVPAGADDESARASEWLQGHRVQVVGVLLVVAQMLWMLVFLSHSFFRADDFSYVEQALSSGFTWKYLMWVNGGHLTPVGSAIMWVLARIAPMSWSLASAVTLVLLAWADLALFRLLRTLFGDHPGILLALLVFLVSPLNFAGLSWWSVAMEVLPLEIAMFSALNAHVRYVWTGAFRYAVIAAVWIGVGTASFINGAAVPVLLLAITSAWLTGGSWLRGLRRTLRAHWRAWVMYLVIVVAYAAIYLYQLSTTSQPATASVLRGAFTFVRRLILNTFVPGVLGGPWVWYTAAPYPSSSPGQYGIANPPSAFVAIAWLIAAAIILVTILRRPRAWRSWAIVLGWLILIDALPVLIGRGGDLPAALLGQETHYLMDGLGVLVVCVTLCVLPLRFRTPRRASGRADEPAALVRPSGPNRPTILRRPAAAAGRGAARQATAAVLGLAAAVFIGSVVSYDDYIAHTSSQPARSYFATVRAALRAAPAGAAVLNEEAPPYVTDGFYGPVAMDASLFGSLRPGSGELPPFVNAPDGTYDHLLAFNGWGQLVPVSIVGVQSLPVPAGRNCFAVSRDGTTTVPLGAAGAGAAVRQLRFGYVGWAPGRAIVRYDGQSRAVNIRKGLHAAFVPVRGSGRTVTFAGMGKNLCIGDVEAGVLVPVAQGAAIPAAAVSG